MDKSTRIICLAWEIEGEEIRGHIMGSPDTGEYLRFLSLIQQPDTIIHAHNAIFERLMTTHVLTKQEPRLKKIPSIPQYRCSMLQGLMCGLPGSLDMMAKSLGLKEEKDQDGYKLMRKMCPPNKKTGEYTTSPEMRQRLLEYCMNDVRVEAAIERCLPPIPSEELELVYLTEKINDLGICIDVETTAIAESMMREYAAEIDERCQELTGGASGRQVAAILKSLADRGLILANLTKKQVQEALNNKHIDPIAREILELRQESSKSSTAKLSRMLDMAGAGNRIRGNLVWHGTNTGRYAGKGVQVQNLPRPTHEDTDTIIQCIKMGDLELMKALYSPAEAVSSALRNLIIAQHDKLLWSDFSSIEARVLAYLAGDKRSLQRYKDGIDLYKIMAAKIYNSKAEDVTKPQRQLGKQAVLACGYQLSGKGFKAACAGYNIEIDLPTSERVVAIYRDSHPEIVAMWAAMEEMCLEAVYHPKQTFRANGMAAKVDSGFLMLKLISGRKLWFCKPHLKDKMTPWGEMKTVVHYTGSYMGKPSIETLYGGSITAMVTQATARDLMTQAMLRADKAEFNITLSVHDEIVCEDKAERIGELVNIMETTPPWCMGLPLKVEAKAAFRYGK